MGANLTVFIVKGPKKFTKIAIKKAEKAAAEVIDAAKMYASRQLDAERNDPNCDRGEVFKNLYEDPRLKGRIDENDYTDPVDFIDQFSELDPKKEVAEFVQLWVTSDMRDMTSREDPDDRKQYIVVAGELSWGDEPDGWGYQSLKRAFQLGITQALGIR